MLQNSCRHCPWGTWEASNATVGKAYQQPRAGRGGGGWAATVGKVPFCDRWCMAEKNEIYRARGALGKSWQVKNQTKKKTVNVNAGPNCTEPPLEYQVDKKVRAWDKEGRRSLRRGYGAVETFRNSSFTLLGETVVETCTLRYFPCPFIIRDNLNQNFACQLS